MKDSFVEDEKNNNNKINKIIIMTDVTIHHVHSSFNLNSSLAEAVDGSMLTDMSRHGP